VYSQADTYSTTSDEYVDDYYDDDDDDDYNGYSYYAEDDSEDSSYSDSDEDTDVSAAKPGCVGCENRQCHRSREQRACRGLCCLSVHI
jgi:hypothetical protein